MPIRSLGQVRRERLLTIRGLAAVANCAPRTIQEIERGARTPQPGTIRRLAAALEVDPAQVREFRAVMGLPVEEDER